jgi:hypothetical protein
MALRETLQRILTEYAKAKVEPLENHPLAQFIRHDVAQAVEAGLGELGAGSSSKAAPARAIGRRCHGSRSLIQLLPPVPRVAIT